MNLDESDFDEEKIKLLNEMISFYRAGKWAFWILVGLGMLASAITAGVSLLKHMRN